MQVPRGLFPAAGSLVLTGSLCIFGALPEDPCKVGRAPFEIQKAVPEAPVLWRVAVPCGASDEMTQIVRLGAGRLLVVYAEGPPQLIDTRRGTLLWTQEAILDKSPTGQSGADAISYLTSFQDLLLLRGDRSRRSRLHAVGLDGKPRWTLTWATTTPPMLIPLVDAGLLLAVSRSSSSSSVAGYELKSGTKLWERSSSTPFQAITDLPSPTEPRRLYLFGNQIEALDPSTGKVLWQRADLSMGPDAPNPKVDLGKLHVLDRNGRLQVLVNQSGKTIASVPLPNSASYSNMVPAADRMYFRGLTQVKNSAPRYVVMAVDHAKGAILWEHWSDEPSISNIIEKNDLLFFGTPSTFIALDRNLGQVKVRSKVTDVGHAFPVRLIEYPGKIVFVGELVVVGFIPDSGREVFREGFDPISQTEHLDGVDAYLAKLWEDLRHYGSIGKSAFKDAEPNAISSLWKYSLDSAAFEVSRSAQESADRYRKSARDSWSRYQASRSSDPAHLGDGFLARQSAMASYAADTEAAMSRAFDSVGYMAITVGNVQRAIADFTQKDRDRVRLLLKTKRFLHSLYSLDKDEDYVWRPRRNSDGTHGLQVVDLRTGKVLESVLTPSFTTHLYLGFECFFDGQDGVIYAQAMRIAADDEQVDTTKFVAKALGKEVYGRYLVAIPAAWK